MDTDQTVTRHLRPTGIWPFVAWTALLFMQLISPSRAWSWLLVGLSLLLAIGYYWARMLRDAVTVERRVQGTWVVAGDQLHEKFTLTNLSRLPVLYAQVSDDSAVPGYSANRVETAGAGEQRTWTVAGVCQRRGVFRLGPWNLRMGDPLGFFEVMQHYPQTTTIMVYPRASFLPALQLPRGRAPGSATVSQRAAEDTLTVGGIRHYAAGDSLRRIHWRASAHHDRLMVREFEREPSGDLWLVVDMDATVQAGQGAEATHEYAVILAASLAAQYAASGERRAVGLLVSGQYPAILPSARGGAQLWSILEALARAEPGSGQSLPALLREAGPGLGSGRTIVIFTASQDEAWVASLLPLMARGNAPTAVLLDATTFSPPRGDRNTLFGLRALLAEQRIPSYVIAQGFPFRPVERIRRQRQELKTLAGFGRVIRVEVEEEV